jgi:hypothetical protein
MVEVILFIFYFIVLSLVLTRLLKRSSAGLSARLGILAFSFKVLMGCCYGYVFLRFYGGDDPWKFYQNSLVEYQQLIHHPLEFFKDLPPGPYFASARSIGEGWSQYIQELEYMLMVKFLAICNILSRKSYYIDILFFDFLVFFGPLLLYKLLSVFFPAKRKVLIICLFFIPPITFWLSGIRAEGLLLLFVSLILFNTHQWLKKRSFPKLIWTLTGLTGFLIFRGQFLVAFLPAFAGWLLSWYSPQKAAYYFAFVYLSCLSIFLINLQFSSGKSLSLPLIKRQKEFLDLQGNTRFTLDTLEPRFSSFVKVFPQAFVNSMVRPSFWEAKGVLQWITAAEIVCFWVLIGMFVLSPVEEWKEIFLEPIILVFLYYGFTQILLIGYVVPFPGAIVRYKAIPELFLIIAVALGVNWKKILKLK